MARSLRIDQGWKIGWTELTGPDADPAIAASVSRLNAVVPGDVHLDLMAADLLPDPYVGMNCDHALWMEHKDWWYRCEFPTPDRGKEEAALLVFHGLDTYATVFLNGRVIGKTDNMFMRHEFDVTRLLSPAGSNELVVRLAAPSHSIQVDPSHGPMAFSAERLFCRKAQMSFGWDIAPRLVTIGIWRPVELLFVDTARITDLWLTPLEFSAGNVRAGVEIGIQHFGKNGATARIRGRVHDVTWDAAASLEPGHNVMKTEVLLRKPPLWRPRGYGEPSLISLDAEAQVNGRRVDVASTKTGIRRVELVREPQESGAESFRFRCNGDNVLVTGLNWTPLDAIFARTGPERITGTLEALAGVGCNMLRVWGGGIYESPHFYSECSRLGIMVWQDFMMACGWYPQTDDFARRLAAEAEQVVRDLRGYPCMALWAGDNEVDASYPSLATKNRLTRGTLAEVCSALDPRTPYIPSSPWRPSGSRTTWVNETEGDSHHYDHGSSYRAAVSWDIRPRFMSEFGHLSLPSLEVVRKYMPAGTEWPITGPMWRYHGADTTRTGMFRGPDRVLRALQACGKPEPRSIEEAVSASQQLQAEAVCAWVEHYCADPEFGGFLLWNVADCWPQHSDAVIDYLGRPKAVFSRLGPLFSRVRDDRRAGRAALP